jgi:hypothetical protein
MSLYANKFEKKGSKKSKRKNMILELYSDTYYKTKLQGLVSEELKNDPNFATLSLKMQRAQQLSVYRRIRAESWENESDEVKAEIQILFDEKNQENADGSESETKDDDNNGGFNDDDDDEKILLGRQQE